MTTSWATFTPIVWNTLYKKWRPRLSEKEGGEFQENPGCLE
jgi:hypothetical protein